MTDITYILVLGLSLLMLRQELRVFTRPSLVGVMFLSYLITNLLPALYVWYFGFPHAFGLVPVFIQGTYLGNRLFEVYGLCAISLAAGVVATRFFAPARPTLAANNMSDTHDNSPILFCIVLAGVIATAISFALRPRVALFEFLGDSTGRLDVARARSATDRGAFLPYLINIFDRWLLVPIAMLEIARITILKKRIAMIWINASAAFLTCCLIRMAALHRGDLIPLLLIPMFLFASLEGRENRRRKNLWALGGPSILLLWFTVVMIRGYGNNTSGSFDVLLERSFIIPVHETVAHIGTFPEAMSFRGFSTITYYANFVDGSFTPVYELVRRVMYPGSYNTYIPDASFVADLWAGFGHVGVIVGSFMLGVFLMVMDRWLLNRRTYAALAVHACLCAQSIGLAEGALPTTLFSMGLGTVPLMYWLGCIVTTPKRVESIVAARGRAHDSTSLAESLRT